MALKQNIHRKFVFRGRLLFYPRNLHLFLLFLYCLTFCVKETTPNLSFESSKSGTDDSDSSEEILPKKHSNGLLPLLNVDSSYKLDVDDNRADKPIHAVHKRRRGGRETGTSDYCKPDNFNDMVSQSSVSSREQGERSLESSKEMSSGAGRNNQAYVYAITQDCQVIFARFDQIHQLARMVEVDNRLTYCLPGLVQLHWRESDEQSGRIGLQLLLKRTNRQICTLPIEFPHFGSLSGSTFFSYSLRSSLNYAVCSFMSNSSFVMEPELSFMDTTYSDIVYFIDPNSSGPYWTVRQFKLDARGYFKALDTFIVRNIAEHDSKLTGKAEKASEYFISLDAQRRKLFAVHKQRKTLADTCAYDLLFRPHRVKVERSFLLPHEKPRIFNASPINSHFNSPLVNSPYNNEITSFSVDHSIKMYAEIFRKADDKYSTKLFLTKNSTSENQPQCVLEVPFRAKFGFVTARSLEELNGIQLPKFNAVQIKSHHQKPSPPTHRSAVSTITTTTVSPKHRARQGFYMGDKSSSRSSELTRDQLLPVSSSVAAITRQPSKTAYRAVSSTTTMRPYNKSVMRTTTIELVDGRRTQSPARSPTTPRNPKYTAKGPYRGKSTETTTPATDRSGSGLNPYPPSSEEGQLLLSTTSKEIISGSPDDGAYQGGYADYENSEEQDSGFHGGGDDPLGLMKTDDRYKTRGSTRKQRPPSTTSPTGTAGDVEWAEKQAQQNRIANPPEPSRASRTRFGAEGVPNTRQFEIFLSLTLVTLVTLF